MYINLFSDLFFYLDFNGVTTSIKYENPIPSFGTKQNPQKLKY